MTKLRKAGFGALAFLPVLVCCLIAFGADGTLPSYNTALQSYVPMRYKDNGDTSFAPTVWLTGDGTHFQPSGDAPARAVNIIQAIPGTLVVGTSTGAAQINTCSLAAVTGKTNYVTGFSVTGGGATSASAITVTLSDGTNTFNYMVNVPIGVAVPASPLLVHFPQPIPAAAAHTAWTLTVPSFGSGNTAASANIWGFYQ